MNHFYVEYIEFEDNSKRIVMLDCNASAIALIYFYVCAVLVSAI